MGQIWVTHPHPGALIANPPPNPIILAGCTRKRMAKPIQRNGKWTIRYFDSDGKRRRQSFTYKRDAEKALATHVHVQEEIRYGLRKQILHGKNFADLCDYWLSHRASGLHGKRSFRSDQSIIERHLRPHFNDKLLSHISIQDVDAYKAKCSVQLSQKTIHNHLTLLISMLNLAKDLQWISETPPIKKPKLIQGDYSYLRTDEEVSRFLRAASIEGDAVVTLYATAIYSGMREGELAGLHWEDIDFERRLITVQRSFEGPTKSGRIRHVPLLDPLLPLLRAWRLKTSGIIVFPNEAGKMHQPSARIFQEVLHRVLDSAAFEAVQHNGKQRRYIVFHDLRHTFASHWVTKGGDLFKLQKILGHQSLAMTMRYAHLAPNAFSEDFSRLGLPKSAEDRVETPYTG